MRSFVAGEETLAGVGTTMRVDVLVQLIEGGNFKTVEDEWLTALDDEGTTPQRFADSVVVLEALAKAGRGEQAELLALTAIEALQDRFGPADTLIAAKPMLLSLRTSEPLREQVLALYRAAHADRPGIERLIEQSGLGGARPPRRALRILDVCLAASPGVYLVGRREEGVACIESVDTETWQVAIRTPERSTVLGSIELADAYEPTDDTDYRVLWHFDPQRLTALLEDDPVPVVTGIVRAHGDRMSGDILEDLLSPRFVPADRWSKWWAKTRRKLKRAPHLRVEGRSPYLVIYDERARTLEAETLEQFKKTHDPAKCLDLLEGYLRECKSRRTDPDAGLLLTMAELLETAAARRRSHGGTLALTTLLVAGRARQVRGEESFHEKSVALLREVDNPAAHVKAIERPELWIPACDCFAQARPDDVVDLFGGLLRVAPTSACDHLAECMVAHGCPPERFDELVRQVVRAPIPHFRALCWLWAGPGRPEVTRSVTSLTLLDRILACLADIRRDDRIDKETVRTIRTSARAALSARKYERFAACLETIGAGMASALRTQISRLDNLGKVVHADLIKMIDRRFPDLKARPKVVPWADASVLYVTSGGMAAKGAEIDELVNVKMRENAVAIGQAAERGDLSENSEYKFALEERDLLRARLARMNAEMDIAQVLLADDVPEDHVGIGSRVLLHHTETGERKELTILSAWEADVEKNIVNYQAPMAQAILGSKPGETVELAFVDPPATYVIDSLANALRKEQSS